MTKSNMVRVEIYGKNRREYLEIESKDSGLSKYAIRLLIQSLYNELNKPNLLKFCLSNFRTSLRTAGLSVNDLTANIDLALRFGDDEE